MPAPYPLLEMPPGNFSNPFDFPAINMAAAHNMFIQGINAMAAHAFYVKDERIQPFVLFCLTVLEIVHHHHRLEETFYFDALEKNLGEGYLTESKEEHATFVPQIEATESWLKEIRDGKATYDGSALLTQINSWSDDMIHHLNHEVERLNRDNIKERFNENELKAIDNQFMKHALKDVNLYTSLPISVVCGNPVTPWFPPLPLPLKWATRYWFSRRHREAWEFGPVGWDGKPKALPSPPT
ncbi:hypothetical protein CPB83DRAFT_111627 [Crepidotus variabilis]|uniref:Hemerythrin-like domain-containing protein n=1 Tax=Crepidotus variabilis TaxID=179855 RepID=A0A9P6JIU9_9AGAR|nr:hypothetical protein CPB83DRAFT_111627 [Crepidotus variabilis]